MEFGVYTKQGESYLPLEKNPDGAYCGYGVIAILSTKSRDGVTAIYAEAESQTEFMPECALRIVIHNTPEVEKLVAGSSLSTDRNWWYAPAFGTRFSEVPPITQSVIWKERDTFGAFLCACDEKYKAEMCGCAEGLAIDVLDYHSGECSIPKSLICLMAKGENLFELNKNCVQYGMEWMGKKIKGRAERTYPDIFEYLGWCSWDAFQIRVSEENLLRKCAEFQKKEIPVRWVILDDMWADCTDLDTAEYDDFDSMMNIMKASRLNSFEASPKRFPQGLAHTIKKINEYGMKVGIWHPTTGYWKGIQPGSELFQKYRESLVKNILGWYQPSFERNHFYEDFYAFLKASGCEFLKVDNQSSFHLNRNMAPIGELAKGLHENVETAAKKYFDNRIINCMGLAVENMWSRPESAITRCSDDFKPEDKAWFKKHILQCTFNCLFIGEIMWCDYDMWWTDDQQAVKNSLLRAVSGGPIYVSDTTDRSKKDILMPLVLEDGRILRCDRPGIPTADCIFENPVEGTHIYKVQNICADTGVLAVYNLTQQEASGTVSPSDVYGLQKGDYVVYDFFSKRYQTVGYDEKIHVRLKDEDACGLYLLVPKRQITFLGLIEKFIAPKTFEKLTENRYFLRQTGKVGFVSQKRVIKILCDGEETEFEEKDGLYTFEANGCAIEIIQA